MEEILQDGSRQHDRLSERLASVSRSVLTIVFGLLPLVFVPVATVTLEYTKILFVIMGVTVALIFYSLSVLRSGSITIASPRALIALWLVVLVTAVSALLSGDIRDALMGNTFGIHTTAFVALLAVTATMWMLVGIRKENVMRLYMLLVFSTLVLVLFHLLRIVFGAEFLSLGFFTDVVSTPIGGWNDLALFAGLTILLSIVAFEQLPLTKWGKGFFGAVAVAALIILSVINFSFVWIVLAVVSIVVVIYTLSRGRPSETPSETQSFIPMRIERSVVSLSLPLAVFIVSALFVLAGPFFGNAISSMTNISYIEVRPSLSATADIVRGVYGDHALLGTGPNKFIDAWRLHKDTLINETIFWNTDFQSGVGYIPTFFVTTGALGGILWIVFLGLFTLFGLRMLIRSEVRDRTWYFIGTSSFVGAAFIWGMALIYVPGGTILMLGALCTGLTFVAEGALSARQTHTFTLTRSRQGGFFLTLGVVVVIIVSVGVLYGVGRHAASIHAFNASAQIVQDGGSLEDVEQAVVDAYALSANDLFARRIAEYQLARMGVLLGAPEPTENIQQQFQSALANGVNAARLSVEQDESEPENWAVLGRIYGSLIGAGVEQSYELSKEALERARELDPKNPLRALELAQVEAARGNTAASRALVTEAIELKSNYSDALYFLSQLDIAAGDVASAAEAARAIISLEPNNPTRYYQLGILEASRQEFDVATSAFEAAVALNPDYANARYFLALMYSELGRPADARDQLAVVLELNPENELVLSLIRELDTSGRINANLGGTTAQPVAEEEAVVEENGDVTTTTDPDTPLVTPVNTPAESADTPEEEVSESGDGDETVQ